MKLSTRYKGIKATWRLVEFNFVPAKRHVCIRMALISVHINWHSALYRPT
jgi:hypothetical protein